MPNTTGKRGGRRPGAGAPKRNLNALKHGHHSAQLRVLFLLFQAPAVRQLISSSPRPPGPSLRPAPRDAAAVGLWLRHLGSNVPPPIPLPPLNRRRIRLFVRAMLALIQRPPEQSAKTTGPKGPLPDSDEKKNLQHNQTPATATPFPTPGAGSRHAPPEPRR